MPRYRVLMIDDQPGEVAALGAAFARLGEVEAFEGAAHAAAALEKLGPERDRFDLILLDQEWAADAVPAAALVDAEGRLPALGPTDPRRQGFGILRFLKERGVRAPVVFCTRAADPTMALRAAEAGAATYYDKGDLLAHPDWALYALREGAADLAWVGRLLRQVGVEADQLTVRWLAGQRATWGRRWPLITQAILERAAALGMAHVSAGERLRLERTVLPEVVAAFREPLTDADLLAFLARQGIGGPLAVRRAEPFRLVAAEDESGLLLAVAEPEVQHVHNPAPPDWATASAAAGLGAVLPAEVRRWPVGPADPFWEVPALSAVLARPTATQRWQLDGTAEGGHWQPLPALAARVGSPGAGFWRELDRQARQLAACDFLARRAVSMAGLVAVRLPRGTEGLGLAVLPFPRSLLRPESVDRWGRPPRQLVLQLHRGDPGPAGMTEAALDAAVARLPSVEIRRSGWPHEFEEETLDVVLGALADVPGVGRSRCIWLGCEFLHAEAGPRVTLWPREYDLVLLAPQGVLTLECKSSVIPGDLLKGHGQLREACRFLWGGTRGRTAWGGAFLGPALMPRVQRLRAQDRVPPDVLEVAPPELAQRLRQVRGARAAEILREYYRDLEEVPVTVPGRPGAENDPEVLRTGNRADIPAVIGFVVGPDSLAEGRVLPPSVVRLGQLGELLRGWLRLPPILSPGQQALVAEGLVRLSDAGTAGLAEVQGFVPEARAAPVAGWEVLGGRSAWPEEPQTVLWRRLAGEPDLALARFHGRTVATALRDWSVELRWLDARGLPAAHRRHARRVALVVAGTLERSERLAALPLAERLTAVGRLWEVGCDEATAALLGSCVTDPVPVGQRLPHGEVLRYAWLPGSPPRQGVRGVTLTGHEARLGRARVLEALLPLLSGPDPVLERLRTLVEREREQIRDIRQEMPDPTRLQATLAAARRLV